MPKLKFQYQQGLKLQNSICNCYSASLVQPKPHHNNVLDKLCLSNNEQIFQIIINADKWNLSSTIFFVKLNGMKLHTAHQNTQTSNVPLLHAVKIAWGQKRPDFFFRADFLSWPFFLFFFLSSLRLQKVIMYKSCGETFFGTEFEILTGLGPEPNLLLVTFEDNVFMDNFF